jgi:methylthioribose-1-phosphate isomerase
MTTPVKAIEWLGGSVRLIDQTQLPRTESHLETSSPEVVADAIRTLKVRGAPAIGIAAAYAVALAAPERAGESFPEYQARLRGVLRMLAGTRPTAVNLFGALRRMEAVLDASASAGGARAALVAEAVAIHAEDAAMCERIGSFGAALIPADAGILTHCNTGALATGGAGTAQSIITTAHRQGKRIRVFADETRPLFQGARLTAWELQKAGIDVTVITDSMAAVVMREGRINVVVVGADRIAANGDAANKIGTYGLSVLARHHGIPFIVAAPATTIDCAIASGADIPIEDRSPSEITEPFGFRIVPEGVPVRSPAFDVTPAAHIAAIVTDAGVHRPPFRFAGPDR